MITKHEYTHYYWHALLLLEASIDHAAELVGVAALKPLQREAIRTFVQEKDVSPME